MTIYRALSGMSYTVNTLTSPALKGKHSANIYSFGMLHTFQLDQTFATANSQAVSSIFQEAVFYITSTTTIIFLLGFEYYSHIPKKNSTVMPFLFIC